MKMRLQKFLSAAGACSRRQGEKHIRAGHVAVNGRVVTEMGSRIDPGSDRVTLHGRSLSLPPVHCYIALNKPKGVVTSVRHPHQRTVIDLIDIPQRLYPVGRLDKDSTGLLLMTNDGRLHHRLLHPSQDHEKEYEVVLDKPIADGALKRMAVGMPILGRKTRPARIRRIAANRFRITLKEGRNRQIRRMARKVGHRVKSLKRVRMANIRLSGLAEGQWRHLSREEKQRLLTGLGLESGSE